MWSEREYIEHYSRLGTTPPADGYQAYLLRANAGAGGAADAVASAHEGH